MTPIEQGLKHYENNELGNAEQVFRAVLQDQPEDLAALANLSLILRDSGQLEEALQTAVQAVKLFPQDLRLRYNLVDVDRLKLEIMCLLQYR